MPILLLFIVLYAWLIEKSEETKELAFTREGGMSNAEQKEN